MRKRGFIIKRMGEDGACLFRAVSDQVYGDQEMHSTVRKHCMDYIVSGNRNVITCHKLFCLHFRFSLILQAANGDYFSQYMTEDFTAYVSRKRLENVHGNHIEMQAMSEMYNRHIEVYCYSIGKLHLFFLYILLLFLPSIAGNMCLTHLSLLAVCLLHARAEPINIFHGALKTDNEPIRLSYHRGVHYNSLVDPFKATVGVGLGLPGFVPGQADNKLMGDAMRQSEETHIEQAMLEDKVKATDWEATNEAIEEQVARESYLDWLRENERRSRQQQQHRSSASTSSVELRSPRTACSSIGTPSTSSCSSSAAARNSPKSSYADHQQRRSPNASPKASGSREGASAASPVACSSTWPASGSSSSKPDWGLGAGFEVAETASFLGQLPPDMFGTLDFTHH